MVLRRYMNTVVHVLAITLASAAIVLVHSDRGLVERR